MSSAVIFDTLACLMASGMLSERECVSAVGKDAMRRGFSGDKAALAADVRARLAHLIEGWDEQRAGFQTDASEVVISMANRRRPSAEIVRAIQRLNMEWADGLPLLSPTEVEEFIGDEIAMVLVRKKAKA